MSVSVAADYLGVIVQTAVVGSLVVPEQFGLLAAAVALAAAVVGVAVADYLVALVKIAVFGLLGEVMIGFDIEIELRLWFVGEEVLP